VQRRHPADRPPWGDLDPATDFEQQLFGLVEQPYHALVG